MCANKRVKNIRPANSPTIDNLQILQTKLIKMIRQGDTSLIKNSAIINSLSDQLIQQLHTTSNIIMHYQSFNINQPFEMLRLLLSSGDPLPNPDRLSSELDLDWIPKHRGHTATWWKLLNCFSLWKLKSMLRKFPHMYLYIYINISRYICIYIYMCVCKDFFKNRIA